MSHCGILELPEFSDLHVAVIIVSYRSLIEIVECLAALETSTYSNFSVVICENGGDDSYRELRERIPTTLRHGQPVETRLAPVNLGYAGGVNFCLNLAKSADAYWILNPDTLPRPAALSALVRRLSRGDCHAVGHDIVSPDGKLASRAGRWRAWSAQSISIGIGEPASAHRRPDDIERSSNYIIGASMLVSAIFVEQARPMREDYFLYSEEVEWCLRAERVGLKLGYSPDAVVVHVQGTSTGARGSLRTRPKLPVYLGERNRLLLTRDLFRSLLPVAATMSLLRILVRYGTARAWRQLDYALAGWIAGLRDERGRPVWMTQP